MSTRSAPSSGDVDSDDEPYLMRQKGVSGNATSENKNIDISSDDPPEHPVASVAMPIISATGAAPADKQKPDDWAAAHGAKLLRELSDKKNDSASEAVADVAKEERDKMRIREDILREIVDKPNLDVSFEEFPYYLSEITKRRLTRCLVQLESKQLIKYSNEYLIPRILLSGPAGSEIYQEMLAKALAHHCAARLLIIDIQAFYAAYMGPPTSEAADNPSSSTKMKTINTSFKLGDSVKYIGGNTRGPSPGMRGRVLLQFEGNSVSKVGVRFDKVVKDGINLGGRCEHGHGFFCNADDIRPESSGSLDFHSLLINTIFETVCDKSQESPFILLIKDAEKSVTENPETYKVFKGHLDKLPVNAVVIGSQTHSDDQNEKSETQSNKTNKKRDRSGRLRDGRKDIKNATKLLSKLFPNQVPISMPKDEKLLVTWKLQMEKDAETLKLRANQKYLRNALLSSGMKCEDLGTLSFKDQILTERTARVVVADALRHHQKNNPEFKAVPWLVLSKESMQDGLDFLKAVQNDSKSPRKSLKDVVTENSYENNLLADVIPPRDFGVTFDDIGALENVKEELEALAMRALQCPELFHKGLLAKPCEGILLFGPTGTGKTMLAKAFAAEAGANLIDLSSISSKWFGDGEKYIKAAFSLASKIAPSVIFVDQADYMLGRRENLGGHEATMYNEFMVNWKWLRRKETKRVVVLAATNRPYDLDEAVVRRLPIRIMVDLPDAPDRAKILKVILDGEELSPDVNLDSIASITDGYSGSDLKNFCVAASYCPIKEIWEKEKQEIAAAIAEGRGVPPPSRITAADIRPLNMADFRYARNKVFASVVPDDLSRWNGSDGWL